MRVDHLTNPTVIAHQQGYDDEKAAQLNEIILEIVRDFAPRNVTLDHSDRMAASITALILTGAVVTIGETEGEGNGTGLN